MTLLLVIAACAPEPGGDTPDDGLECGAGTHEDSGACVPDTDTDDVDSGSPDSVPSDDSGGSDDSGESGDSGAGESGDSGAGDSGGGTAGVRAWSGELTTNDATWVLRGENSGDIPLGLAAAGDFDGDGEADVAVGAPYADGSKSDAGKGFVVSGPVSADASLSAGSSVLSGDTTGAYTGARVRALGDVDGDGRDDLLFGSGPDVSSASAGVWLLAGGTYGASSITAAAAASWNPDGGPEVAVAGLGDVTGDGLPDLAFSAPYNDDVSGNGGAIYIFSNPVDTSGDPDRAEARLYGFVSDSIGDAIVGADLDGDGVNDLAEWSARKTGAGDSGCLMEYVGPFSGASQPAADAVWEVEPRNGSATRESLGALGDVDADGLADVGVCIPSGPSDEARCYIVGGLDSGTHSLYLADAVIEGASGTQGTITGPMVDLDLDGHADFAWATPAIDSGTVYLYYGPISGSLTERDADATFTGATVGDGLGYALEGADVTGDGWPDLLLLAAGADGDEPDAGAVYVFAGG